MLIEKYAKKKKVLQFLLDCILVLCIIFGGQDAI